VGDAQPVISAFADAGYRLTEPRRAVAELIAGRKGHFTAADLADDARGRRLGIGRATIFRALDVLAEVGIVERIDLPSGQHAYISCEPAHHHHVVCSRCGTTADVDDQGISGIVREIAAKTGYVVDSHRLELYGLCPACRARSAA
jgi:Fur family ferric uptake transcriptional regulator